MEEADSGGDGIYNEYIIHENGWSARSAKSMSDNIDEACAAGRSGWEFNSIKTGPKKRPESQFAISIGMNSEKWPGLYCFGPFFT